MGDYSNLFNTGRSLLESCAQFWTLHLKENVKEGRDNPQENCNNSFFRGITERISFDDSRCDRRAGKRHLQVNKVVLRMMT